MKRSLIQLIGSFALVSMLGFPVAIAAAGRQASASVDVRGVVRPIKMENTQAGTERVLGIVNSEGQVLALRKDTADQAAFAKVSKAAGKEYYVRVMGVRTSYEGMPAVRVQKVFTE